MYVLLMRHGEAVDSTTAGNDRDRYLTDKGRKVTRAVVQKLEEEGVSCTHILTSPWVRAVQTAEILATHREFNGPVKVWAALSPESFKIKDALAPLRELDSRAMVALVGHEPSMSELAGHLIGLSYFTSFRKSAACLIHRPADDVGSFRFMLNPRTLILQDNLESIDR